MGYERKRGKLSDLNALLRGDTQKNAFPSSPATNLLFPHIKYVITLDADTQLPLGFGLEIDRHDGASH
jgi:cyclic beta-1,2-glucan synthetase